MNEVMVDVKELSIGRGNDVLLERIGFTVPRGQALAILGASGVGKSTLLRCLMGLDRPLAGEVWIDGVRQGPVSVGRPRFGVLFQSGALFGSLTIRQNVALPLEEWTDLPSDVVDVLARVKIRLVGLEGSEEKLPSQLSGGMRKRAGLARAMALEPPLVFLDEPTAGLDPMASEAIDEVIITLNRVLEVTVVMVTHDLASMRRVATRCLLLDRPSKQIIADGTPDEIVRSSDTRVATFFRDNEEAGQ